jgi:hypothetical protein
MYWDWARREANDRQVWLGESPEAQKNRGKSLRVTIMVAKSVSRRKCRLARGSMKSLARRYSSNGDLSDARRIRHLVYCCPRSPGLFVSDTEQEGLSRRNLIN